jgi:multisubunit Na+/H+ antiporter MnhF subunit
LVVAVQPLLRLLAGSVLTDQILSFPQLHLPVAVVLEMEILQALMAQQAALEVALVVIVIPAALEIRLALHHHKEITAETVVV